MLETTSLQTAAETAPMEALPIRLTKGLNFLVGELSLNIWRTLNTVKLFDVYQLDESFLNALRDLDCLIFNAVNSKYRKTSNLIKVTPERVYLQMDRNANKKDVVITHPKTPEGIHEAAQMFKSMEARGETVVGLTPSGADLIDAIKKADEELQSKPECAGCSVVSEHLDPTGEWVDSSVLKEEHQRPKKIEILPKQLHQMMVDQQRRDQIMDVINTRAEEGLSIPIEWIEEYNEIIERRVITRI